MLEVANPVHPELLASTLDWWRDAGVDTMIDEVPVAWLARGKTESPPKAATERKAVAAAPVAPPVEAMPKDREDFVSWLLTSPDVPKAGPPAQRVAPSGNPDAAIMVVIDMPEAGQTGSLMIKPNPND